VKEVAYRLSMLEPHSHLFEVEMRIASGGETVDLVMPSWTPGSYLLREFPRNVQDFTATDDAGHPLAWSRTDKNGWRVEMEGAGDLRVSYRVYANELTVRTSHLDASHGYVNGASVFMFVRGREAEPVTLDVEAPPGWKTTTALPAEGKSRFRAADYDQLVDSPLEIGEHLLLEWEQSGRPHRYAVWGSGNLDPDRLIADTRRIIATCERFFGDLPYASYTFILHLLPDGRGGLEHRDSCSLQADRWAFEGEAYENFVALVAHEFFHVWNGKRIRPEPLGPFDYTRENYTRSLWVVEGLTTYYTELILRRAGLVTPERFLARLAESITRFRALPGRHRQTLADSSFDSWIRFYRPDEHTPNAQISYYQKGALVGMLLDLELRRRTGNERSLDDLMRLLWERYGAVDEGYPEAGAGSVEALASELSGSDLSPLFDRWIRGTDELEYERSLTAAGLAFGRDPGSEPRPAAPPTIRRPPDPVVLEARLGVRVREQGGRLRIAHVLSDTPGWRAGLNAADELVALDGLRISSTAELANRVWAEEEGSEVLMAVFRRDQLLSLPLRVGSRPTPRLQITHIMDPTPEQDAIYSGWLEPENEPS
jgi:predicted metalloprotease with PDZ domain